MNLTEDQILTLAPDESSKKSGKDLSNNSKWISRGVDEQAVWGECQGSGSKPYQTTIDIRNIAFKCSCPSRKFPCKHGLGLLLLYSRNKESFVSKDQPAWVTDWISRRSEKEEKKAEKQVKPTDEAAQAKRQQARQTRVADGIAELTTWMKDIIRNDIMAMPEKNSQFFENMARRLVDAQAPGIAGMVRNLGEINFYAEGWPTKFMDQLLKIYMVSVGYQQMATDTMLMEDLRTWIGFTQNHEALKEGVGTMDTWLVLGKQVSENDAVTTEKFWLYGTQTGKNALLMQFVIRGQGVQYNFTPGMYVQAELVFFPSAEPQRALVKRQVATTAVQHLNMFRNWLEVAEREAAFNSIIPFRNEVPFLISGLRVVQYNQQWWLQDNSNHLMSLRNESKYIWKLLAISGGEALDMAVIGKEDQYEPFGVWKNNEYKII